MDDNDDELSSSLNGIVMLPLQINSFAHHTHHQQHQHQQQVHTHDIILITNNTNTNGSIESEDNNDNGNGNTSYSNSSHINSLSVSNRNKPAPYFHRSFPSIQTLDVQWETIESGLKHKDRHKNVSSSQNEEFYSTTNQNSSLNNANNIHNGNTSVSSSSKEFNFKHILHPVDHEFEDFAKMKIDFLENMKTRGQSTYTNDISNANVINNNSSNNAGIPLTIANIYDLSDYDNSVIIKNKRTENKRTFLLNEEELQRHSSNYVYTYTKSDSVSKPDHTLLTGHSNKAKFKDVYHYLHNDNFPSKNKHHFKHSNNAPDAFDEMFAHYFTPLNQHAHNTYTAYNKRSKSFKEIKAFNYKQHKMRTSAATPSVERKMNTNVYNKIETNKSLLNSLFKPHPTYST